MDKEEKREWRLKLAKALKSNDIEEINFFLAFLQGYLDHEEPGKFKDLMLSAMEQTKIEKTFNEK